MVQLNLNKVAAIFSLLFFINSSAQSTGSLLPKKEFRINLETVMYQKLLDHSANSLFNSRDAPSGVLSISNYYRLKHNFAIEPSIGLTVIPYNYNFDVSIDPNHPLYAENQKVLDDNITEYILPSSIIGLSLSKEFKFNDKATFFTSLGLHLNTYPTYSFGSGYSYVVRGQQDSVFRFLDLELTDGDHSRAFWSNLSYSCKFGFINTNSVGNGYNISFVFNFQPSKVGTGSYYFDLGTHKETGTLTWKNSYYGFCFSKSFNRDKNE